MAVLAYALPFFALTLFVSAFLLFLVQPLIGKLILPSLGGTPQVWNTCMVFFQTALLAGYAYTHFVSTRLKLKTQLLVHCALLILPLLLLYIYSLAAFGDIAFFFHAIRGYKPITGGNPIFSSLWLLFLVVFLPFFVVATSAPLLQKWFAHTGHPAAKDPYFLYGASNLGSFLSLVAYPLILERMLFLPTQSWVWTIGYTLLVVCFMGCVALIIQSPKQVTLARKEEVKEPVAAAAPTVVEKKEEVAIKAGAPAGERVSSFKKGAKQFRKGQKEARRLTEKREEPTAAPAPVSVVHHRPDRDPRLAPVTPLRRLRWIALAAIPSSLMLGVTTYATTDLSPIPLLWLIPLMLYLLSFILVFSKWPTVWVEKPHDIFVMIQPFAIAALIMMMVISKFQHGIFAPIAIHMIAFFVTTMVCHGELAKDRPATEHLTEFYLLMSVGGMLGGMFNGLVAPILFVYVVEYGLAIFFSALMRPRMAEVSWIDQYFEGMFGAGGRSARDRSEAPKDYPLILDIALPIVVFILLALLTFILGSAIQAMFKSMLGIGQGGGEQIPYLLFIFGVGLLCSILFMQRPLRYGLLIGGILLIQALYTPGGYGGDLFNDRSYFGVIRVREGQDRFGGLYYTNMIHGTTDHGMNFRRPSDPKEWGLPKADFSRLATTYYHRRGPAGRVMELFNWFPDKEKFENNSYDSDAHMPVTLVGMGATPLAFTGLPAEQLVALWCEPPFATIGLGTGTMASYARPFQHMHYYEIDKHVLRLSMPGPNGPFYKNNKGEPLFTELRDAKDRGANLWVLMGDARLRMAQPYGFYDLEFGGPDQPANPQKFDELMKQYHDNPFGIMVVDGTIGGGPDNFYHMMVVDAFSSDAIPVHLITEEAIKMYFTKLTEDGVLCVHTSNKYVNLVPVVADVTKTLKYKFKDEEGNEKEASYVAWRGHDNAPMKDEYKDERGHYTSEWVMVVRKDAYFKRKDLDGGEKSVTTSPAGYDDRLKEEYRKKNYNWDAHEEYWKPAASKGWQPWTDNYSNVLIAIRWGAGD